jgi:hypothetical protein
MPTGLASIPSILSSNHLEDVQWKVSERVFPFAVASFAGQNESSDVSSNLYGTLKHYFNT